MFANRRNSRILSEIAVAVEEHDGDFAMGQIQRSTERFYSQICICTVRGRYFAYVRRTMYKTGVEHCYIFMLFLMVSLWNI